MIIYNIISEEETVTPLLQDNFPYILALANNTLYIPLAINVISPNLIPDLHLLLSLEMPVIRDHITN